MDSAPTDDEQFAPRRLFDHPIWPRILPHAHINIGRANLDFLGLPDDLRAEALDVRACCVSCGGPVAPLRARALSIRSRISGMTIERRLFYAATCPQHENAGCARSRAAKQHKAELRLLFAVEAPSGSGVSSVPAAVRIATLILALNECAADLENASRYKNAKLAAKDQDREKVARYRAIAAGTNVPQLPIPSSPAPRPTGTATAVPQRRSLFDLGK